MNPTSKQQFDALINGALPAVEEVRPGLYAIAFDMPGLQPPYALSYAVLADEGSRDVHLIDAGLDSDANWEALGAALAGFDRQITDIASVTITHMHPDHTGLAWRIREASGAVVRLHEIEAATMRDPSVFAEADPIEPQLERWGVPADAQAELVEFARRRSAWRAPGVIDETVVDGDRIGLGRYEGRVIHTPGHTAGHICIAIDVPGEGGLATRLVCTGDHVLPGINPGIALGGERAADPLGEYYASLDKLADGVDVADVADGADVEVLPGHGFRFTGLRARCDKIRKHHERRTNEVEAILAEHTCETPLVVWEVASRVTWSNGWEGLQAMSRLSALAQTEMHVDRVRAIHTP